MRRASERPSLPGTGREPPQRHPLPVGGGQVLSYGGGDVPRHFHGVEGFRSPVEGLLAREGAPAERHAEPPARHAKQRVHETV